MANYRRLTRDERYQIEALLKSGLGIRAIARQLKREPSSISREVKKLKLLLVPLSSTSIECGSYSAGLAEEWTQGKRRQPRFNDRKIQGQLEVAIREKLLLDWSPEQISGKFRISRSKRQVCFLTIYRYIERDKAEQGELWKHLRILRKNGKDRKIPSWRPYRVNICDRVKIKERPKIVEQRSRLGDFERDSVLGIFNGSILLTIVDRTSRLLKMAWLPEKNSQLVHRATVALLKTEIVNTITNDNGSEFARHKQTAQALDASIYFSRSYRAWERGTNENLNGLIRQYFPRKRDIGNPSPSELRRITHLINSRPRKCLGYKTPLEVHAELKAKVLR